MTVIIYEWISAHFNFEYNVFSDKFNLLSFCIDIGIWVIIFVPVHLIVEKAIFRKG